MTKILLLGSNGQLGSLLTQLFLQLSNFNISNPSSSECDLSNENSIINYLYNKKFDILINCAAFTNVDLAEEKVKLSNKINSLSLKFLCDNLNQDCSILHISTDYVFDGNNNVPYIETDFCRPLSQYGKSKHEGEKILNLYNRRILVVRTAGLYSYKGHNFLTKIVSKIKNNENISVIKNQYTSTTSALDLSNFIYQIIVSKKIYSLEEKLNIFHYVNDGNISWFEFAEEICKIYEYKKKIEALDYSKYKFIAKRPKYSVLNNSKLKNYFNVSINNFNNSLKNCIYKFEK
tara:strand:- start:174 stop:1043 length:870 start_codon:yes stop_codon:yes gene_type:complete